MNRDIAINMRIQLEVGWHDDGCPQVDLCHYASRISYDALVFLLVANAYEMCNIDKVMFKWPEVPKCMFWSHKVVNI